MVEVLERKGEFGSARNKKDAIACSRKKRERRDLPERALIPT